MFRASRHPAAAVAAGLALVTLSACDGEGPAEPATPTAAIYDPDIPTEWAAAVTNPFFPLAPGTTWRYEAETEEGLETIIVEVLEETRMIMSAEATIVLDRVFLEGELIERTEDHFAQDLEGNVWYLGEETEEIEDGEVVSTEGSWLWGVDGALPGIIMWADPAARIGEPYRQEFLPGEAEDWGLVVDVEEDVTVPFGDFAGCIQTEDLNPFEPGVLETKFYCPDIGLVLEEIVRGGEERVELVEFTGP